ncbi:ribonuclease H2 non-catalytic subunit-domain-containing protein [Microdochium trichocladiopsis]|uniref:Ribonuclease H2 non-catalytic subunit-domain-containing protein n=1 Tax=Microdochium trichocladiopsis TaxID=1682393 RepID=A0A9P8Y9I3_9PEZI|nr:ribonuclease H2 non-catalytic subunit-domain-containing protein [Microdochium trichocladiopsis]KAH7035509.1 ribonuclease H2 non-catalytic subunit-domain-containing protein [Microdochium trichocladiopsis]
MSQPILTVEGPVKAADQPKTCVNLLPARIHHDGEVGSIDTYWKPAINKDGTQNVAYLRGRKLYGKTVKLPEGYYGAVASRQEKKKQPGEDDDHAMNLDDGDDESSEEPQVASLRNEGVFDEFVVWGHESVADAGADAYVRSIEEWIGFAEKLHAYPAAVKDPST